MLKKLHKVALIAIFPAILSGCVQTGTTLGNGQSSGVVSGSSAGATSVGASTQLERCSETLGTLAIDDARRSAWWGEFTRSTQITDLEPLIRLFVSQSNCFVITTMGSSDLTERMNAMMAQGRSAETRVGSNVQTGQAVMADFFLSPSIQFTQRNTRTANVVGAFSSVGAALIGDTTKQQAEVTLTLVNIRARTQLAAALGVASTTDNTGLLSAMSGANGGQLNSFERTPQGKTTVAAFVDAFNQMIIAVKNYKQQQVRGGLGTGGLLKVQGQ